MPPHQDSARRRPGAAFLLPLPMLTLVAGLLAFDGQAPQKQEPAATFRSGVDMVQVDAVVLDAQGRFVPDLRQDEFEVLEGGKPQRVATLQVVNIPVERMEVPLVAPRPIQPDVKTNERPFDGRLYLIVLDDLHTDPRRSLIARHIAREFIQRSVAANDLAAVVHTSGNRRNAQDFTDDRQRLLRAVESFVGRKTNSLGSSALSAPDTPQPSRPQGLAAERLHNARSSLQTLSDLVAFAGRIRDRRKAVVLIGEGIDDYYGRVGAARATGGGSTPLALVNEDHPAREMRDRLRAVIDAANRANVTLYAFDPRVYTQGGDEFVDLGSGLPDEPTAPESDTTTLTTILDSLRDSQDNLRTMANETGGFAVTGSPMALDKAFERVRIENSSYYILGYYAANEARDGTFRRIEVRAKRPGLKVEARRGYTAPKGNQPAPAAMEAAEGTSPALRDALLATLPVSGLTLRATAAPFKGPGPDASVVVTVQARGADLQFTPQGDRFTDSIELSIVAVDGTGTTRGGERFALDMPLTARMQAFVAQAGLAFVTRVAVPAGSYQLRIAGRDAGSGKVGCVHLDLDVPDFTKAPLSMSGLLLTAEEAGQVPNPRPDEELAKLLPGTPITTREFDSDDVLTLVTEVYDNRAAQPHTVVLTTTLQAAGGRVVFEQQDSRPSTGIQAARGGFGHVASVPLSGLSPGLYLLSVAARSSLDPDTVITRDVPLMVRSRGSAPSLSAVRVEDPPRPGRHGRPLPARSQASVPPASTARPVAKVSQLGPGRGRV